MKACVPSPASLYIIIAGTLAALAAISFLAYRWLSTRRTLHETLAHLHQIRERFAPVTNLDDEKARIQADVQRLNEDFERLQSSYFDQFSQTKSSYTKEIDELKQAYKEKKEVYDRLVSEVAVFDERLAFGEMGIYEPHFDYADGEEYKKAIEKVRKDQKRLVELKIAVTCPTEWVVEGSRSKGQTMANRAIKLALRAFNNECEAAIANCRWNNVNAMTKRIIKAREQIDKLNETIHVTISDDFVELKLKELHLTHEYREKLKQEREERSEAARLQREEQRLQRDLEEAEQQEEKYGKLLEKAKAEAASITGEKLTAFAEQIKLLEQQLAEAHAKAERAKALAEKTRSGYVYIISNIGSFGEGVVKIGLTRRLDPLDRVRELGDASVPFIFDTHAIIYSDDAPTLERSLHSEFEQTRINAQNYKKEFFRVSLDEVELAVKRLAPNAPFFKDVEAQEYRETLYKRQLLLEGSVEASTAAFPEEI